MWSRPAPEGAPEGNGAVVTLQGHPGQGAAGKERRARFLCSHVQDGVRL